MKSRRISHFVDPNLIIEEKKNQKNRNADRSDLGRLYPVPKTYEQYKEDDARRVELYKKRLPKYPIFYISFFGSLCFGLIALFLQNLGLVWTGSAGGGGMAVIFFSFAIWLGLYWALLSWIRYVNKSLYMLLGRVRAFWSLYGACIFILLLFWLNGFLLPATHILWIPILATAHLLITLLASSLFLRTR